MKFFGYSDRGLVRRENEDSFFVPEENDKHKLFLIADGIGGESHGKLASMMAVDNIVKYFIENEKNIKDYKEFLTAAIKNTNENVRQFATGRPEFERMGTTLVAALIKDDEVIISNAGDSRCYMIRKGIISQLTVDNSYVQYLLQKGAISTEEAQNHPQRNLITKAIGLEENIDIDTDCTKLYPDDILLLCTDGLTSMLSDEEILHIILEKKGNIQEATEYLVNVAKEKGGTDNITAILVEV